MSTPGDWKLLNVGWMTWVSFPARTSLYLDAKNSLSYLAFPIFLLLRFFCFIKSTFVSCSYSFVSALLSLATGYL
jgi:hypothetical protein